MFGQSFRRDLLGFNISQKNREVFSSAFSNKAIGKIKELMVRRTV